MNNTYQDFHSRYHDQICVDGKPSSNNGWIYTSIARYLGLVLNSSRLRACYEMCEISKKPYKVSRSPYKSEPPLSHDEVVGLASLGLLDYIALKKSKWQYNNQLGVKPIPLEDLPWVKAIIELWKLRNLHRNEVWMSDKYPNAKVLAFRLKPDYTYYLQQLYFNRGTEKTRPNLLHKLYFYGATYVSLKGDNNSTKNIRWVMLKDLEMEDSFLFKMIDIKKQITEYFDSEHPFTKEVK